MIDLSELSSNQKANLLTTGLEEWQEEPQVLTYGAILICRRGKATLHNNYKDWELHEGASQQAARFGQWKAIRNSPSEPIELYDLSQDQAETNNLANTNPDIIARAESIFHEARTENPDWPLVSTRQLKKKKSKK